MVDQTFNEVQIIRENERAEVELCKAWANPTWSWQYTPDLSQIRLIRIQLMTHLSWSFIVVIIIRDLEGEDHLPISLTGDSWDLFFCFFQAPGTPCDHPTVPWHKPKLDTRVYMARCLFRASPTLATLVNVRPIPATRAELGFVINCLSFLAIVCRNYQ